MSDVEYWLFIMLGSVLGATAGAVIGIWLAFWQDTREWKKRDE